MGRTWLFTLFLLSVHVCAEEEKKPSEEEADKARRPVVVISPSSLGGQEPVVENKPRAHFAGARRGAPEKKRKSSRPKRGKNPWFLSKTQPKPERKGDKEEELNELPEDAPRFTRRPPVPS